MTTNKPAKLELKNISKVYDKGGPNEVTAVQQNSLSIEPGEFVTVLGPSGCGKTTILRMIAGFETPSSGGIFLDGKDITTVPPNRRPMSLVFQSYALFPHLSVQDNVGFGLKIKKVPAAQAQERVEKVMEKMDILEYAKRPPHALSGGQQQRVALARAIVMEPRVLLFDEPLSNLDARLRDSMRLEIRNIQREFGITSVFVTHDQDEAMTMSDKIVIMSRGKIEQVASPEDIYRYPKSRFVADFLGTANFLEVQVEQVRKEVASAESEAAGAGVGANSSSGISDSVHAQSAEVKYRGESGWVPAAAEVSAPGKGCLVLRAEDFEILPPDTPPAANELHLPGTVKDAVFYGNSIKYQIQLDHSVLTVMTLAGRGYYETGRQVCCRVKSGHGWLIKD